MTGSWTALVLAGQRPGPDALAAAFGERWKVLIPVGGVPMVRRVVETLSAAPGVGRVIVLAQDVAAVAAALPGDARIDVRPSSAGISASIAAIAGRDAPWPVLVTTGDHPLLTPAMVAEFVTGAAGADVAVGLVERADFARRFPNNRRTWLKFRGGQWSGANLFALGSERARAALDLWMRAERDRKQAWKLFWHFGPWLALRAITRTISLPQALAGAGRKLGLEARLVPMRDPVAAIDVDKPSDHALAEHILSGEA